ncbi:MAG TPA: hypothetical protein VFW78_03855 [Bacteroidia bacterium]|nr:hypothetical protein [Bacteroidia bacterium]
MNKKAHYVVLIVLCTIIAKPLRAQLNQQPPPDTVVAVPVMNYKDTVYQNMAAGELTPGKGFLLVKNEFASLNFSMYAMARYLNQGPGDQTWYDHLGRARSLTGRNDFNWHRTMLWFTGFVGTPKFTYMATVWTVMTTQQTLVYGNLKYSFCKGFSLGMGISPNMGLRSLQGPFPFFTATDRTMAEDAIRPGFTNGLFANGFITSKLGYNLMLGNNLSALGVQASKLTRDLSKSASVFWMPTTGEFGPRGGLGDLEHHNKLATRFGASFTHARDDRFNGSEQPSPDNTQVRLSDGVLLYETGALADNVTVDKATYQLASADIGFKYKGFCLFSEGYYRVLDDFVADGPLPVTSITDMGYTLQVSYMVMPKVCLYGVNSMIMDDFKRNPWEAGGGINFYPKQNRNWRINTQLMHIEKSAAGGTFGLYNAGQTGTTFTFGVDILI